MSDAPTVHHRILGTAGHVDHGKSSLVKAFTGVDPDRLPEEQQRGLTIDLGFTQMDVPSPNHADVLYSVGIVDVPGHTDFINNMVSGIGSIDAALLTVAADDGWMPQSEEHLQILSYLGIQRLAVAVTKSDLVAATEPVIQAVRDRLRESLYADAPIVPVSVTKAEGLEDLTKAIGTLLDSAPPPPDLGKPRLPIDRVFTRPGLGTIVTGTLTGGTLEKNQPVVLQPSGLTGRIRGIQSHNQDLENAQPGMRCALNLGDVAIASRKQEGVRRGDVVTLANLGDPSDTVDVQLVRYAREQQAKSPLKHGWRVRWHHGGSHELARIYLPGQESVAPGETALAQVRFESPVFAFAGDRFILRNLAGTATTAGGTILEPNAVRKGYRTPEQVSFLRRLDEAINELPSLLSATLDRDCVVNRSGLLIQSHFRATDIDATIETMREDGTLRETGPCLVQPAWWTEQLQTAASAVDRYHQAHPEHPGMPLNEWRSRLPTALTARQLSEALMAHLCREGFVQDGAVIRREDHAASLPPHLEEARSKLMDRLNAAPFEPPSRKDLSADPHAKEVMKLLVDRGEALVVGPDLVLLKQHFEEAKQIVVAFIEREGAATLSQIRGALETTRRVAVPLAEHLDRTGVTIREGDRRVLKKG